MSGFRDCLAISLDGVGDRISGLVCSVRGEFVETIRSCRFLLPLVDDSVDSGSYLIKLPAAVASSLGLGVPLIINQSIADRFDLQYMICYPGDDLASGLKAEQRLSEPEYAAMLASLDRHAEALYRRNIKVLGGLIERITGRNPEGYGK